MSAAAVVPIHSDQGPLYEIIDHLQALFDTAEMIESPEDRKECDQAIERYIEAELRKVDGIAGYLAHLEDQQEFADQEIRRLQRRKEIYEARERRLRDYVISVMERFRLHKLEGRTATLSLRACPPSVQILDEAAIPDRYRVEKTVVSIDRRAIRVALEADLDVPGADLVIGKQTLVRR